MQKKNIAIFCSSNMVFKNSFWKDFKSKFHCEYQDFINIENIHNLNKDIDVMELKKLRG